MDNVSIILKDIATLANTTSEFILIDSECLSQIKVGICGPEGTPYHTGLFEVSFHLPKNYPLQPPMAKFETKIFHPNIGTNGRVCVDVLAEKWSPSTTLYAACELVQALLRDPNGDSPLNIEAATMMDDPEMFNRTALLWTRHFANGSHTYDDFEERLQIVAALKGNIHEALKLLSRSHWDVQSACDKVV